MTTWWSTLRARERAWRNALGRDISTPNSRRQALFHYNWIDHGILRTFWHNFHEIAPGVWRSNQPSPKRLAQFKSMGIMTILNLRGSSDHSQYLFETEACTELGLTLIDRRLYAKALASREEVQDLVDIFRRIERPFVMHCKSGSDRTGFAAAIWLHVIEGKPMREAARQLDWRHFHLRHSKNGVLDFFFDDFIEASESRGVDFDTWLARDYDPEAITARFREWRGK